jgi:alginate O-acetyltransferase complex protein AlgI
MLFNDYPFLLVFLPASLLIYRLVDPYPQARIPVLVLLSLVFYAYGNPPYVLLLIASIAINWLAALAFTRFKLRAIPLAAIVLNLVVLGFFKYTNFFMSDLGWLSGEPAPHLDIVLPLGISFFTFHHIMYLVDLRRGRAPLYAPDRYALYISFFPQLLAGPLVRWSEVMEQFGRKVYVPGWQREFAVAVLFITIGLVEKIFLADRIAHNIDPVYSMAQDGVVTTGDAWLALAFNIQILFDFAGYSDIAIGLGYALDLDRGKHLLSLVVVPLIAFLLPASQDIIAWLTRKPRPWLFVLTGLTLFVILLDLGERNVAGFGYFNF